MYTQIALRSSKKRNTLPFNFLLRRTENFLEQYRELQHQKERNNRKGEQ